MLGFPTHIDNVGQRMYSTKSTLGATIGNITVSAPACADDIALLGESKDIQAMLNLLEYNTKRDLVKLNPEKTEVINVSKALQTMYSRFSVEPLGTFLILHAVQVLVRHILFVCLYSISLQYLFSRFLGKLFQGA
jgi:hypothetical protein